MFRLNKIAAVVTIGLCMGSFFAFSQPGSGPNDGQKPGTVPISGIEILVVMGGALGMKKILDLRKLKK